MRQTEITVSRSQRCARVGVHTGMPHRRYREPRRRDREFEAVEPRKRVVVVPEAIAEAGTRDERDQVRVARDPHRVGISGHDDDHCPPQAERSPTRHRPGWMTLPSRDATTWSQAAYRSGVTASPSNSGCPARATPTSLSWNRNWVRISGADRSEQADLQIDQPLPKRARVLVGFGREAKADARRRTGDRGHHGSGEEVQERFAGADGERHFERGHVDMGTCGRRTACARRG